MPVDERISAGSPVRFSAARETLLNEAAAAFKNGIPVPLRGLADVAGLFAGPIEFKNTTGVILGVGSLIGFGDPVEDPETFVSARFRPPRLEAIAVDAGTHGYTKAVVVKPAGVDKMGAAVVCGMVWAKVNMTNEDHPFAVIDDGNHRYTSSALGGDLIFYRPAGTGLKWCAVLVNSDGHRITFGTASGAIPAGGSGSFSIVGPPVLSPPELQTCYLDRMDEGIDVQAGAALAVAWIPLEHKARILWAICPPAE